MNLSNEELEKIKTTMEERTLPVDVVFVSDEVQDYLNEELSEADKDDGK